MLKLKPNMMVSVDHGDYSHIGEVMSYSTPDGTAMVRMVPGHPGTLEEMGIECLSLPVAKPHKVHYAQVTCRWARPMAFPVDMLRYDNAAPVNFSIKDGVPVVDPSFGLVGFWVATTTPRSNPRPWTPQRWRSFGWELEEKHTELLTPVPTKCAHDLDDYGMCRKCREFIR